MFGVIPSRLAFALARRPSRIFSLFLALALLAGPLRAAPPPTSTQTDTSSSLSPRGALLRSAVLPGWGQLYNHRPLKGIFCAATSTGLLVAALAEQRSLNQARTSDECEERAARRNTRLLLFALSATFSALDAYVDAHLSGFGEKEIAVKFRPYPDGKGLCLAICPW